MFKRLFWSVIAGIVGLVLLGLLGPNSSWVDLLNGVSPDLGNTMQVVVFIGVPAVFFGIPAVITWGILRESNKIANEATIKREEIVAQYEQSSIRQPTPKSTTAQSTSTQNELQQAKDMLDQGLIDEDEYKQIKQRILGV